MTIINPNSIAGITSVTAEAGVMNFYKSDGTLAGLQLNGVNFNTTSGISTFNNVYVGGTITYEDVKNVDSVGIGTFVGGIHAKHSASGKYASIFSNAAGAAVVSSDPDNNANNSTVQFHVDGSESARIDSSGRVLIGTTNAGTSAQMLTLYRANTSALEIRTNTSGNSTIHFTDGDPPSGNAAYRGYIEYRHSDDDMRFATSASERLRIDSAGLVGIGTTNPDYFIHVESPTPYIRVKDTAAPTNEKTWDFNAGTDGILRFRNTNDAANSSNNWLEVERDGVATSSIRLLTGSGSERLRIKSDGSVNILETGDNKGLRIHTNSGVSATNNELRFNTGQSNGFTFMANSDGTSSNQRLRITSGGCVYANNFGIGTDDRWKIRGNTSNGDLAFEYSTSSTLSDSNIKAYFQGSSTDARLIFQKAETGSCGLEFRNGTTQKAYQMLDSEENMVYLAQSGVHHRFYTGGSNETLRIQSDGDVLLNKGTQNTLMSNTSDGNDNQSVFVGGGGGPSDTRGAYIWAKGNEYTTTGGYLQLNAGNVGTAPITFSTAGSERARITSDGKLGIGVNNPNATLTVSHAANTADGIQVQNTNNSQGSAVAQVLIMGGDNAYGSLKLECNGTNHSIQQDGNGHLKFVNASTERLRIVSDGKVVIGGNYTNSANFGRQVLIDGTLGLNNDSGITGMGFSRGHANTYGYIGTGAFGVNGAANDDFSISTGSTGDLLLGTSGGTERLRITNAGFVGINEDDPQTQLNVKGTISTGRNVARELGTVISSSTSYNSSRDAENVLSGKKNYENGNNDWLTAGNQRNNAWLIIDLGSSINVDRAVIYNQNEYDHCNREVKNFTLEGSNDNSSWTAVLDDDLGRSNAHEPNPGWSFRIPQGFADDNEGNQFRYWRFTMKTFHGSDSYGGIMEIELYEANNVVTNEITTSSLVAGDVYAQTGCFNRITDKGGTTGLTISNDGQVTKPSSCAFNVTTSGNQSLSSGDTINSWHTTNSRGFENTQTGGYFSSGVFTAPVTGAYFFTSTILLSGVGGTTGIHLWWQKNNSGAHSYWTTRFDGNSTGYGGYEAVSGQCTMYMSAGDTCRIKISFGGSGCSLYGTDSNWGNWGGFLIG